MVINLDSKIPIPAVTTLHYDYTVTTNESIKSNSPQCTDYWTMTIWLVHYMALGIHCRTHVETWAFTPENPTHPTVVGLGLGLRLHVGLWLGLGLGLGLGIRVRIRVEIRVRIRVVRTYNRIILKSGY